MVICYNDPITENDLPRFGKWGDNMRQKRKIFAAVLAVLMLAGGVCVQGRAEGRQTSLGALAAGSYHSVLLQPDGTAAAAGYWKDSRCDVSWWHDVVKVAAGSRSLGLCSDGTVMVSGESQEDFSVAGWTQIADLDVSESNAIGVRRDGTVVITGPEIPGQDQVSYWRDVCAVAVGSNAFYGLKKDGTVVTAGGSDAVAKWRDIVQLSAGKDHVVGLRSDGTVVAAGSDRYGQCQVSGWKNVQSVSAGGGHTVALLEDGTVVAAGDNGMHQCGTESWYDIVDVSAGLYHTLGLRQDGVILAVGSDGFGQLQICKELSSGVWTPPTEEETLPTESVQNLPPVVFGTWDFGTGSREPIRWQVLGQRSDLLLLISEDVVDVQPYHSGNAVSGWAECDLRRWLNGEFYQQAFTDAEREQMFPQSADSRTDLVTLLSTENAGQYFADDLSRTVPSGVSWLLRTRGSAEGVVACVSQTGAISEYGTLILSPTGIRPVILIAQSSYLPIEPSF